MECHQGHCPSCCLQSLCPPLLLTMNVSHFYISLLFLALNGIHFWERSIFFPLDFDTFFLGKSVSNFCEGFCCFAVSLTLVCFESCYYALDLFFLSKCKYIYIYIVFFSIDTCCILDLVYDLLKINIEEEKNINTCSHKSIGKRIRV